jgi:hypothetical protein
MPYPGQRQLTDYMRTGRQERGCNLMDKRTMRGEGAGIDIAMIALSIQNHREKVSRCYLPAEVKELHFRKWHRLITCRAQPNKFPQYRFHLRLQSPTSRPPTLRAQLISHASAMLIEVDYPNPSITSIALIPFSSVGSSPRHHSQVSYHMTMPFSFHEPLHLPVSLVLRDVPPSFYLLIMHLPYCRPHTA